MDRFIALLPAVDDGDLRLCLMHGIAYQADRSHLVAYDEAYFDKCASYEDGEIARRINAGRVGIVAKHFGSGAVVDIGIGSGEFIRCRPNTFGRDVNPVAIEWLKSNELWVRELSGFKAFTFWDVLEHVETPEDYFRQMPVGASLFACIPVFADLHRIRESKHYRPGEHLYYWSQEGFAKWMSWHDFALLDMQDYETQAGRENVRSFAFRKMA